ncbi:hypothetical protein DB346_09175 [Verrucomicrobia bacterium LW23]|nr:hypothetical protein DB346_09175 [Verrucomicrobia bacterium LW23]
MGIAPHSKISHVVFPGEEKWLLAGVRMGQAIAVVASANTIRELLLIARAKGAIGLALPVRLINCCSALLPEASKSELGHAAGLEAERLGVMEGRDPTEAVWDWRVLPGAQGAAGTDARPGQSVALGDTLKLVTLVALPRRLDDEFIIEGAGGYSPSFEFWRFAANHGEGIAVWRELGCLVAVALRKGQVVCAQALTDDSLTPTVLQEIRCMHFQLEAAGILPVALRVVVYADVAEAEAVAASAALGLPVEVCPREEPTFPSHPYQLMPNEVVQAQAAARRSRARWRVAMALLAAYALFLVGWIGWIRAVEEEVRTLDRTLAQLEPRAREAKTISARWYELDPVLDTRLSPLATLLAVVECLPPEGIRLTRFAQRGTVLEIESESRSGQGSAQFTSGLQKKLTAVTWEIGPPRPNGTGMTTVSIKGKLNYAPLD